MKMDKCSYSANAKLRITSLSLSYQVTFTVTNANYLRDRRLPPRLTEFFSLLGYYAA
jgi:hypothetical protein